MQVTFPALLFIVFLVLKLTSVITWSWWWVTAPIWIPIVTAVVVLVICFLVVAGINFFTK